MEEIPLINLTTAKRGRDLNTFPFIKENKDKKTIFFDIHSTIKEILCFLIYFKDALKQ